MSGAFHIGRRGFLAGLGLGAAGLAIGLDSSAEVVTTVGSVKGTFSPNVFIHISKDSGVTFVCHRSEMGQGIRSSFVYLLADELGADANSVKLIQADGDEAYGSQNTDGSTSIRRRYDEYRRLAAVAREALIAAAAKQWRVPAASLVAEGGLVKKKGSDEQVSFGDLAEAASKVSLVPLDKVRLRQGAERPYAGRSTSLLDAPLFVTGQATYAADVKVPGVLVAVIQRPPVVGSRLDKVDSKPALAIAGVKQVVEMPHPEKPYVFKPWGGVAVLATNTWAAMRGRAALSPKWVVSADDKYDSISYKAGLAERTQRPGEVRRNVGDIDAALAAAANTIEADYYVSHLNHTPMEPPAATAHWKGDGTIEIWACTQNPQSAAKAVADALGIDEKNVLVHVTFLGGAFGRKSKGDFVAEAAWLSREVGAPVRVQWTREDDIRHDYMHSVSYQKLTAALDRDGEVQGWRHRTAFPPISSLFNGTSDTPSVGDLQQGVCDLALQVKNVRAEAIKAPAYPRIGWLRSVYNIFHAFSVGSFVDEIALATKRDPVSMWKHLIGPARTMSLEELGIDELSNYGQGLSEHPVDAGRLISALERVADLSRFAEQRKQGRALGLAVHRSFLAYTAAVISVARRPNGGVHVDEAWVSIDAGTIVNVDRARSQMEGAVIFGINLALNGGVTFKEGMVEQSNFHDLRLARIGDAPRAIHVDLIESEKPPAGIGEPGLPPIAPAMANAYAALTGERLRELPMGRHWSKKS